MSKLMLKTFVIHPFWLYFKYIGKMVYWAVERLTKVLVPPISRPGAITFPSLVFLSPIFFIDSREDKSITSCLPTSDIFNSKMGSPSMWLIFLAEDSDIDIQE